VSRRCPWPSAGPSVNDALGPKARKALHRILIDERGGSLEIHYPRFSREDTLGELPPRNVHTRLRMIGCPVGLRPLYRWLVGAKCAPVVADEIVVWIAASYARGPWRHKTAAPKAQPTTYADPPPHVCVCRTCGRKMKPPQEGTSGTSIVVVPPGGCPICTLIRVRGGPRMQVSMAILFGTARANEGVPLSAMQNLLCGECRPIFAQAIEAVGQADEGGAVR
jgi:hypothetical protein